MFKLSLSSKILFSLFVVMLFATGYGVGVFYQSQKDDIDFAKLQGEIAGLKQEKKKMTQSASSLSSLFRARMATTPQPTRIIPTPMMPPQSKSEILWRTYNFTDRDKSFAFSFRFPDVGDYCNGCFDGWPSNGGSYPAFGQWITGSYYKDNYDRKWSLTVGGVWKKEKKPDDIMYNEYWPDFIKKLEAVQVGGNITTPDRYNEKENDTFTRLPDKTVMGLNAKLFEVSGEDPAYLLFINRETYYIVVTFSHSNPVYDVFDEILSSFSQSLYEEPNVGESLKDYRLRSNNEAVANFKFRR